MKKYIIHDEDKKVESHIDFKGNLNAQQYEVITGVDGPCLVLAGAGSGKTRTLIYRLAYLLERGVPPGNILLMTFTNKAAREMRERTEMLLRYNPKGLWSGTFHHVGNRSLRMYAPEIGFTRDFGILDEHDSKELLKACVKKTKFDKSDERFPKPSVIKAIISFSVNTKKTIKKVVEEKYPYLEKFTVGIEEIKKLYDKKKFDSGSMDYDDLLFKWKTLLKDVPKARSYFSEKFRYIMVDEYQDTNFLQAEIIDILGECHRNILVVGDDAQSIYSFRGARVENILNFPKKYEDAKMFKLETNYRSTPEILDLANDSLLNNDEQFDKELKAVNAPFEKPVLVEVRDLYSQAKFVAQRVRELRDEGIDMKNIAVLFRAHYQSAELEMELVKSGMPYVVRGGIRFFEQAHIKDVLAYLRILVNPADEVAWIRALTLCPGIGPGYAEKIYNHFRKTQRDILAFIRSEDIAQLVSKKGYDGYSRFRRIMKAVTSPDAGNTPGELIKRIMDFGYSTHLLAAFENAKDRIDDISELVNFSHEYEQVNEFLSDITLRENFKGETKVEEVVAEENLVLSTIHQAKGLEWDAVIVIGLCEGQFPHPRAYQEVSEMEEERRLFYVAVTRARKYLYLIHPATRYDYQKGTVIARRSRFLEELFHDDYEVWQAGSKNNNFDRFSGDEDRERVINW
ncbi:MAG: ATP-dependent helicase [Candidatus Omnitrophota bacterium]